MLGPVHKVRAALPFCCVFDMLCVAERGTKGGANRGGLTEKWPAWPRMGGGWLGKGIGPCGVN